jgi:hypothetical protein
VDLKGSFTAVAGPQMKTVHILGNQAESVFENFFHLDNGAVA